MKPNGPRVLLVDDDALVASAIGRLFAVSGLVVETCTDSYDAGHAIERFAPQVVVLDIAMPGLDGLDLLQQLRARHWHGPVIVFTGLPIDQVHQRATRNSVFRWLRKPATAQELLAAVNEAASTPSLDNEAR